MEYSIIDSQMRGDKRDELVKYANKAGYTFYSEMLHDWHKKAGMNSAEIARKIIDDKGQQLTTQSGVYYILNRNGFFDKKKRYNQTDGVEQEKGICSCCKKAKVKKGKEFSKLCHNCWKDNGSNSQLGTSYFDDPSNECHSGISVGG